MKKLIACLLLATIVAMAAAGYGARYERTPGPLAAPATLLFERGVGFRGIAQMLADKGVIDHPLLFAGIAVAKGKARQFKAGEYEFAPGETPKVIMDRIAKGDVVIHKLTIAEGLTTEAALKLLMDEPAMTGEISGDILEGSLLPQTYHFTFGQKRMELVKKMQEDMGRTLMDLWSARKQGLPFTTPQEALTLASIVEKETGVPSERPQVAAVFVNRLRLGMRLQSDPTTAYGLKKSGKDLTSADLQNPNPYNTYVIPALPPGPISNPGKASIEAVLNPPETKDLYFVATGNGGHNFAPSLKEHENNVKAYLATLKKK